MLCVQAYQDAYSKFCASQWPIGHAPQSSERVLFYFEFGFLNRLTLWHTFRNPSIALTKAYCCITMASPMLECSLLSFLVDRHSQLTVGIIIIIIIGHVELGCLHSTSSANQNQMTESRDITTFFIINYSTSTEHGVRTSHYCMHTVVCLGWSAPHLSSQANMIFQAFRTGAMVLHIFHHDFPFNCSYIKSKWFYFISNIYVTIIQQLVLCQAADELRCIRGCSCDATE